jgi:uncharacterized repeat protein (TIGR03803 family)
MLGEQNSPGRLPENSLYTRRNAMCLPRFARLGKLSWENRACALLLLCATTAIASPAQTLTTIHSFDNTDGYTPLALVQAGNGSLYGTTDVGGADLALCGGGGCGTVFEITPSGKFTSLLSLDGSDGSFPFGFPLIQAPNGDLYGTLQAGGSDLTLCFSSGCGTFFKITPAGALTTLYDFCSQTNCTDGSTPLTGLIQATDGDFYGTTNTGGANGDGTVFKITANGRLTTLHNFCSQSNCADGGQPYAGLVQATNGDLYGTTPTTIFKMTPSGTLKTLYTFCAQTDCPDGYFPGQLIQAADGNLYGATLYGGANTSCVFREHEPGCGTIFRITSSGTLNTLHSFDNTDGAAPFAVIQATDGNFYGATLFGGTNNAGTIFRISPKGTLTTVYSFCAQSGCLDGMYPETLLQDTNGKFYGPTYEGGSSTACTGGCGTIFSLSVGLKPFVETQTTSGKVGAAVKILGTSLTGATNVTFNGTSAIFTVVSGSLITTTVPPGATTGKVQVVTPSGTLTSNVNFQVTP